MSITSQMLDTASPALFASAEVMAEPPSFDLVGESPATQRLRLQIDRIGPHFRTLLVHGEIGTGKELVARALHSRSRGEAGPFLTCHGAALAEACEMGVIRGVGSPWETVLTGRPGTIYLDGIDNLSLNAQSRLLDLIRGWKHRQAHPRMIAATGQDLRRMLGAGQFRPDLYHRLAALEILIEPLRERREDIPPLATHFLHRFALLYGKKIAAIDEGAMQRLHEHHWPGNVREFENVMRNGVLECDGPRLETTHLGRLLSAEDTPRNDTTKTTEREMVENLQEVVDRHVMRVLNLCGGNKVRAAELLGISRSTLYRMLEVYAVTNGRVA
jgi:DNA-binding NtrC family response regulator